MTPAQAYRATRAIMDDPEAADETRLGAAAGGWGGFSRTSSATRTVHGLHLGRLRLEIVVPVIDRSRRRPLAGWMAFLLGAVCLDVPKLWCVACGLWLMGRLPMHPDVSLALLASTGPALIIGVGGLAAWRFGWRCFFPAARVRALSRRRRGPDAPPEARRCGVPVGPRRPPPLAAAAKPPDAELEEAAAARRGVALAM